MNSSSTALKFSPVSHRLPAAASGQFGRWGRAGRAVWQALEAMGQARARRELLILADRWETTQPELAAQLRATGLNSPNA